MTPNNKNIIRDVIRQELQDQLIIERVKISHLKALLRDILTYDQGRAYIKFKIEYKRFKLEWTRAWLDIEDNEND